MLSQILQRSYKKTRVYKACYIQNTFGRIESSLPDSLPGSTSHKGHKLYVIPHVGLER